MHPLPSDGSQLQIVRTSGFRWGYFVKLWTPRLLDSVMRIAMSSRCRAFNSCTAKDAIAI